MEIYFQKICSELIMYLFQFLEVNNSYLKNLLGKIYYWLRIRSESNYDHRNELENNLVSFPWFSFSCFGLAFLKFWFRVIYLTWQSYERSFKFWFPDGAKTFDLVVLRSDLTTLTIHNRAPQTTSNHNRAPQTTLEFSSSASDL